MRTTLSHRVSQSGSGLVAAMCATAFLSLVLGSFLVSITPKYRTVHQAVSWHDAYQAAEGGVNYAIASLNRFAAEGRDPDAYRWEEDWAGGNWTAPALPGERSLAVSDLPRLGGRTKARVSSLTVDVYTRNPVSDSPWFRIRSSARADLPDRYATTDRRDLDLRRMKLGARASGLPDPHVTRTIETIMRPKMRFRRAITTKERLTLGTSSNWRVDSFDSRDPLKSDLGSLDGGLYPSSESKRQDNGDIATLQPQPGGVLYSSVINGHGAVVKGDVSTVGGDDPATAVHENVSGSNGMDQNRIFDNFEEDLPNATKPQWTSGVTPTPWGKTNFQTSSNRANPKRYIINGNLGSFEILPPIGGNGYVEIIVNGNLASAGGGSDIVIPPGVYATIYVDGNVSFGNGNVNSSVGSSRVATHLTVVGVSTAMNPTYSASGSAEQTLSFYGPQYAGSFNGGVETIGSVILKSFSINGGGNGGFHFDEALNQAGPVVGWEVAGFFEDSRAEVK